ncbi:MAG: hypothetical protein EXS37_06585 [Opitutus sp.]|nr:hypothetical protein [Opitutus sp.]
MRLSFVLLLTLAPLFAAEPGAKSHLDFRAEARVAYERKDFAAAKRATMAALALRPDSPRYLHNLAALRLLTGDEPGALATLRQLAALGVATAVERDPDLAPLQGTPAFREILRQFAVNRDPQGEAEVFAEIPGRTGIAESIAYRPRTGDLFLGDVHHCGIWRRDRTGQVTRFTAEDGDILGIFGLGIDEERNTLWAAMSAVPEMAGYTPDLKNNTAIAEFNLTTGELRRFVEIPLDGRDHSLGDLVVAPDGTIYATDSKAPVIWQLAPGAEDVQKVVDSPVFSSLQGLVLEKGTLLVADYANGLFAVDLATGAVTALAPPRNVTLLGLDGLVAVLGGIVATQNGVEPHRVVRITLSPEMNKITGFTVLAASLPDLGDLSLVTLVNGRPTLIAGSGWDVFESAKTKPPPAHTVRIFQVALP